MVDGELIKVEALVEEFLAAQSLKILPQAPFGDAVNQFVNKDDKHAMEAFVSESLAGQVKSMLDLDSEEEDLESAMEQLRAKLEEQYKAGVLKRAKKLRYRPKPDDWDSDMNGAWEDNPDARMSTQSDSDDLMEIDGAALPIKKVGASQPARGRGARVTALKEAPAKKAPPKKAPVKKAPARGGRGRKNVVEDESEDEDEDGDEDMGDGYVQVTQPPKRAQPTRAAAKPRQTKLNFSQKPSTQAVEISDDEISDDPFESAPTTTRSRRR